MTLPSGAICLSDVNTELGRASNSPVCLNDADVRALAEKPSGGICMSDLQGKSDGPIVNDAGQWLFCNSGGWNCYDRTMLVMPMGRDANKGKPIGSKGAHQQSYPQYMRGFGAGFVDQTVISADGNKYSGINGGGRNSHMVCHFDKSLYGKITGNSTCWPCSNTTGDAWSWIRLDEGETNAQGQGGGCWSSDSQFYFNTFLSTNAGSALALTTYKLTEQPGNDRYPYELRRVSLSPPFSFDAGELTTFGFKNTGMYPEPMGKFIIFKNWRRETHFDVVEWMGESIGLQYRYHADVTTFHPNGLPDRHDLNLSYAGTNPAGTVAFFWNTHGSYDLEGTDEQQAIAYACDINQTTGELTLKDKLHDKYRYVSGSSEYPCMDAARARVSPDGRWFVMMNGRKTDWQSRPNIYMFYFVRWDDTSGFEGKDEIKAWTPSDHQEDSNRSWECLQTDFDISRANNYIAYCGRPNTRLEKMTFYTYEWYTNQDNPIISKGNPDQMIWSMDDDWRKSDATCNGEGSAFSGWNSWNKTWTQVRFRPTGDLREMEDESIDLESEAEPDGKEES